MAKAKTKKKPPQKQTSSVKAKNNRRDEDLPDDMYDEVDAFHKQKDMIRLDGKDEEKDEEDSEEDFGVYDMANDSEEEEDGDESEDDEHLRACKPFLGPGMIAKINASLCIGSCPS